MSPPSDVELDSGIGVGCAGLVIIRNFDDEAITRHREHGRARRVSMEQQPRDVLSAAACPDREELPAEMGRIRALPPKPPPGRRAAEGWEPIRGDRDSR